jgi:bifunctional non-homologous end joining protein LigD
MGLEGIVSKRRDAPHRPGRNLDWQKTKCLQRQEFVVVGYYERSNNPRDLGALMLGAHEKGKLVYCGHVGTGWNDRTRKALYGKLVTLEAKRPSVELPRGVTLTGLHWVKPKLVAEVAFLTWTNDGFIRHPSFQGLREDKRPRQVVIERPTGVPGLIGGGPWERSPGRR